MSKFLLRRKNVLNYQTIHSHYDDIYYSTCENDYKFKFKFLARSSNYSHFISAVLTFFLSRATKRKLRLQKCKNVSRNMNCNVLRSTNDDTKSFTYVKDYLVNDF